MRCTASEESLLGKTSLDVIGRWDAVHSRSFSRYVFGFPDPVPKSST